MSGAKDGTAGQAIATRMESTLPTNHQTFKGLNNDISLIQTVKDSFDNINSLLRRANALVVQAKS